MRLVVAGHSSSVLDAVHVIAQIAHFEWDKPEVAAAAAGAPWPGFRRHLINVASESGVQDRG